MYDNKVKMPCANYGKFNSLTKHSYGCGQCVIDLNKPDNAQKVSAQCIISVLQTMISADEAERYMLTILNFRFMCNSFILAPGYKTQPELDILTGNKTYCSMTIDKWKISKPNISLVEENIVDRGMDNIQNAGNIGSIRGILNRMLHTLTYPPDEKSTCKNFGKYYSLNPNTVGCGACTIKLTNKEHMKKISAKCMASIALCIVENNEMATRVLRPQDNIVLCDGRIRIKAQLVDSTDLALKFNKMVCEALLADWLRSRHETSSSSVDMDYKFVITYLNGVKHAVSLEYLRATCRGLLVQLNREY